MVKFVLMVKSLVIAEVLSFRWLSLPVFAACVCIWIVLVWLGACVLACECAPAPTGPSAHARHLEAIIWGNIGKYFDILRNADI